MIRTILRPHQLLAIAAGIYTSIVASVEAGSVLFQDPVTPAGGIGYEWTVALGANDSAEFMRFVGAWSWEDNSLFSPGQDPVGWTHTSDFVALTLSVPQRLTIRLERQAGVPLTGNPAGPFASTETMNPSFTLWSGWDNDGGESHMYNNDRNISWAEDITYVGHVNNSSASVAEFSWDLPAGNYTIALGSNAPSDDPNDQGYKATFTTTVPEPGSALFLLAGLGALGSRRRRSESCAL